MNQYLCKIHNASQIVLICSNHARRLSGSNEMNNIEIVEDGSIIVDLNGKICAIDKSSAIDSLYSDEKCSFKYTVNAKGKSVIPGLIDSHTHPIWSGDRVHEFIMKLGGASYMDIHKKAGGIGYTVKCTKESTDQQLLSLLNDRLTRMIHQGTTLVECKSGYGLDTETEVRLLRLLKSLDIHFNNSDPVFNNGNILPNIISSYLIHSIPQGFNLETATEYIINNQIPAIVEAKKNKIIDPKFIDIFCEKGVYELNQSKAILEKGIENGFQVNFHGEELKTLGSASLAVELNVKAISHLENIDKDGVTALCKSSVIAVILPTTSYLLHIPYAPGRALIDGGCTVALASDFNPNAHCLSLPFVMNLACVNMKLTPNEALVATTLNAAASIDCSDNYGSLEVGKFADFLIIDSPKWEHIIYELVDPPIYNIFKGGRPLFNNKL